MNQARRILEDDAPVSAAAPGQAQPLASWYLPGVSDAFGDRLLMFDNTAAASLELLRFKPEFGDRPGFESALRQRVDQLKHFSHPSVAKARRVERLGAGDGLALVSNHAPGRRLSELLSQARGATFAIELVRQLTPLLAVLQTHGGGMAHGALTADRIIVTPEGRLVLTEYAMGPALQALHLPDDRLRGDFGLAVPDAADFRADDPRTDVIQLGVMTLSLLLGRRVHPGEYPEQTAQIFETLRESSASASAASLRLRSWLERALQLDGRPFTSALEACKALDDWPADQGLAPHQAGHNVYIFRPAPDTATPTTGTDVTPAHPADEAPHPALAVTGPAGVASAATEALAPPLGAWPAMPTPVASTPIDATSVDATPVAAATGAATQVVAPPDAAATVAAAPLVTTPVAATPVAAASPAAAPIAAPSVGATPRVVTPAAPTPVVSTWAAAPSGAGPAAAAPIAATPVAATPVAPTAVAATPVAATPVAAAPLPATTVAAFPVVAAPVAPTRVAGAPGVTPVATLAAAITAVPGVVPPAVPVAQSPAPAPPPAGAAAPAPAMSAASAADASVLAAVTPADPVQALTETLRQQAADQLAAGSIRSPWKRSPRLVAALAVLAIIEALLIADLLVTRPAAGARGAAAVGSRAAAGPAPSAAAPSASSPLSGPSGALAAATAAGRLDVTSDPSGARVSIDGTRRGVTPLALTLEPGRHAVVIDADGASTSRTVDVLAGGTASVIASLTSGGPQAGWVSLHVPIELQVRERGRVVGTTAADRLMLPAGRHDLELASAALGFRTTTSITVLPGKTASANIVLPDGSLSINAVPWANVWIDGKAVGTTPLGNLAVPIGTHEVVWRHPQLGERRQTATVTTRSAVRMGVDLTR
jgi:hypothetical protein